MLWLALYCPTLALDCILRRWPDGIEPAMAVTDMDGTRRLIAATTRTAQACGVFAGQSVATALALLPDLLVVARKLEDERRAITEAALAALRFTPTVSLRTSGLVMELSASVRLFGGRRALQKSIASTLRLQGLRVAAAEAPTPHGAWLLAKEKARRHFQGIRRAAASARAAAGKSGETSRDRAIPAAFPRPIERVGRARLHAATPDLSVSTARSSASALSRRLQLETRIDVVENGREAHEAGSRPDRESGRGAAPHDEPHQVPGDGREQVPVRGPRAPDPRQAQASGHRYDPGHAQDPGGRQDRRDEHQPHHRPAQDRGHDPGHGHEPHQAHDAGPSQDPDSRSSAFASFVRALDAVPIPLLESLGPSARRMDGIGLHTFADLRRLPTKGLARRFGEDLIDELARAAGDRPDPQIVFDAPARFDARIELMARVETAEALIFASQRLLAQLGGWLTARRAAVRGFTLVLHHDRWTRDAIEPTAVEIALATPSSDLARIVSLVRERLSRLELKAPVLELSLDAPTIVAEQELHGTLFPEREQPTETLARLLEKLIARLGHDAIYRIERVADHRPERAWREVCGDTLQERIAAIRATAPPRASARSMARTTAPSTTRSKGPSVSSPPRPPGNRSGPATDSLVDGIAGVAAHQHPSAGSNQRSRPGSRTRTDASANDAMPDVGNAHRPIMPGCSCGPRPVWLLTEPRQLEVRTDRPLFESLPLFLMAGPERIETGWWDDAPATRDYYIAENAAGHLVWIYRERLLEPDRPVWYLQGLFA